ncbi:MAG: hypothetical protein U0Y10_25285 [Spirosomataceae bacterium]
MSKLFLICTSLFVLFLTDTYAQLGHQADSLASLRQFDLAELEYERTIFELNESSDSVLTSKKQRLVNELLLRKTYCQKTRGDFAAASRTTQRFDLQDDSLQYSLRYETILCAYLSGQYEEAYSQVQQLKHYLQDSTLWAKVGFLEVLSLVDMGNYDEAKQVLKRYCVANGRADTPVDSLFLKVGKKQFKNLNKAKTLATFMPGAGLVYAGSIREGVTSLALQAAALGYGVFSILDGYYFSGFLTGFGLFQAFYFGGIRRTESILIQHNQAKRAAFSKQIRQLVLQIESARK